MRNALALLLLVITCTASGQQRIIMGGSPEAPDWPKPQLRQGLTPEQTAAAIAGYTQSLGDKFSGVVLVAKDGKPLLQRAWGYADREAKTRNTIDTKFNIGSINKVFTKRAIEQLAAQSKLSMTDTVRKHLPDYPSEVADRITIKQLLEHRSGLGDIFGPRFMAAPPSKLRELRDFLALFADQPLKFEPGTDQRYSNAGYVVLGLIVEKLSGMTYRDYVEKNIFAPAGMKSSGFWAVDEKVANRAVGYARGEPNYATLPGRPSSAGGAYATAADLLRFFQWTKESGIGVGGGAPGLNAAVEVDDGWTVVTMANLDPPAAEALARNAMSIIRGREGEPGPRRRPMAPAKTEVNGIVAVPLDQMDHLVTVQATLNGKGPFTFEIDTGSGGMMRLSQDIADQLNLEVIGETVSGDPSGKNMERRQVVRVDTVDVGGAKFSGVNASVGGRMSIIGLPLFGSLTAALDFPKHELRLSREPLPASGDHIVPFTTEHGIPVIEVEAGGVKLRADVDSGSPAIFNAPPSAGVPLQGEPRVIGHARTANNEFDVKGAELKGDLKVAGWTESGPMVNVIEAFPIGNVGSRFLRNYVATFDMVNKRLQLTK